MAEATIYGIATATADAELKHVGSNNTAVCNVNLVFNRSYKSGDEWKKEPCFIRAQAWGNKAEKMAELVKKGQNLYVAGHLKQENWEQDGKRRVSYSISIQDYRLCESFSKNNDAPKKEAVPTVADDDIPF